MIFRLLRLGLLPAFFVLSPYLQKLRAQCPNLNTTATLTSPDCTNGSTPCDVCPGDQITLTATGTGLPPGGCVDWYYGTTNNFNPYAGQGTFLGCSPIDDVPPPQPCNDCPITVMLFVDACGTEQDNEWMLLWSGSGFNVGQLSVDLSSNNNFGAGNGDLGTDCPWMEPTANAISSIQTICPGATVVGAGPGDAVPPNVPVIIFTSAGLTFNYNFSNLCPLSPVIYVMQNSCVRSAGAFSNASSGGTYTITTSLDCGCDDVTTYNSNLVTGGNGGFVVDAGLPFPIYGNAGCLFPPLPWSPPPPPPPIQPDPITVPITQDMCNGGPYWVVGIVDPLAVGCPQDFTNYLPFNVVCPDPQLLTGETCTGGGLFDLNQLEDPAWPNGTWTGPGVSGTNFNPIGQSGTVQLTFTATGPCAIPATTTIEVSSGPTAQFQPLGPVCEGATEDVLINFTGTGPWSFSLAQSGSPLGDFTTSDNPFSIPVTFNSTSTLQLTNLENPSCTGQNASIVVSVAPQVDAEIDNNGPSQICPGQSTTIRVNFSGGTPPYTFIYDINGLPQNPITTNNNPHIITVAPNDDTNYSLVDVQANGCPGTVSGFASINVVDPSIGTLVDGTTSICEGQSATLEFEFDGTAPFIFVYSLNGVNRPPITTINNNYTLTVTPPLGDNTYALVTMSGGSCPGLVNGEHIVTVSPRPEVELSGDASICGSGSAELNFNFTGTAPFVVNYTANGQPQPSFTSNSDSYDLTVTPSQTTTYVATAVSSNGCTGTAVGQAVVTVGNALSATLSGGGQICQGGNGIGISVSFVGDGPYTFVYSANNVPQPPITTSANPFVLNVNPTLGTLYRLVSVENPQCTGTASGQAWVFVFTSPTAEMLPVNTSFCNTANTQIEINLTGTGPFTLTYSANGVTQPAVQTSDDPYFLPVNVTSTTVYTLVGVQSPGCNGTAIGTATVQVNTAPAFANLQINCDQAAGTYRVEFDAINFTPPLSLTPGSFSGTFSPSGHFVSDNLPLTSFYTFTWDDGNGCGPVTVSGQPNCNCTTAAGTMNLTPLTVCQNAPATAIFNNNAVLDADDTLRFILHTNPAIPVGQILAWSTSPSFPFLPGMQTGTTYYISAIAGNQTPIGQVDLTDPCLSVAPGTPVVWRMMPSADFAGNDTICSGQQASLTLNLSGTPPFSFVYLFDGVAQPPVLNHPDATYTINFSPTATTLVTIENLEDNFCTDGTAVDSGLVVVKTGPTISSLIVNCNAANSTYTIEFDASGTAPFTVNGLGGTFTGGHFVSVAVPFGDAYSFSVSDADNCGAVPFSGQPNCACTTNAGTMSQTPLTICQTETATATHNGNQTLDANDALLFILHTLPGNAAGTILAWNNTPTFGFQSGMSTGTTYYISAFAGNPATGGQQIDPADPCRHIAPGTPVTWVPAPTAGLTVPDITVCPGGFAQVPVSLGGTGPFTLTYSLNNVPQTPATGLAGPTYTITLTPNQSTTVTLVNISTAACASGTASGQTEIEVKTRPTISNLITSCNAANTFYTVVFNIVGGEAPYTVTGVAGTVTGNTFTSVQIPVGTNYSVTLTDGNQCGSDTRSGTALCNCVSNAGPMSQTPYSACVGQPLVGQFLGTNTLDANDTTWYILHTLPGNPVGDIISWRQIPSFPFFPGTTTPGTTYYISAIVGNTLANGLVDLLDPCLSVSTGTPVMWNPPPTATLQNDTFDICPGQNQPLTISFTGRPNYTFQYTLNGSPIQGLSVQNQINIGTTLLQNSTFTLTSVSDASGCTGTASGTVRINVHPAPVITNVGITCNPIAQTYVLEFDVTNADLPSVFIGGGITGSLNTTTGHFTSAPISLAAPNDQYFVTIEDQWQCGRDTVSGIATCSCATYAGDLVPVPDVLCPDGVFTALTGALPELDVNDTLVYLLVTTQFPATWTIVGSNSQPTFGFDPATMEYDSAYFVVPVAGNTSPNAPGVDFSDPCFSLGFGPPVIWRKPATATLAGTDEICAGEQSTLTWTFTGGGPYTFTYLQNGTAQAATTSANDVFTMTVSPSVSTTYTPQNVSTNGCPGTVSGSASVTVVPQPTVIDVSQTCDFVAETYTVTFKITNGAAANPIYTVNGLTGTLTDTTFTSVPIPFNTPYNVTVSNPTGCERTLTGANQCFCTSNAGTIATTPLTVCTTNTASIQPATGTNLDTDDALQYILYQDFALLPNGVLATSNTPEFTFLPTMTVGATYFISAVVGNKILPGTDVDLNDPCLSVSAGTPVIFVEGPTASIAGNEEVCPGGTASFQVNFTGQGPFTFVYALNGTAQPPIQAPQTTFPVSSNNIQQDQTFTLISVSNGVCPGTVSGTATVEVLPVPTAELSGTTSICPGQTATLTLTLGGATTFDVYLFDGIQTDTLTGIQTGHTFIVTPTQTTTYTIEEIVATGNTCPPQISANATIVTVESVLTNTTVVDQNGFGVRCNGGSDGSAEASATGGTGPYNFEWSTGDFGPQIGDLPAGKYFVTVTDVKGCAATDSVEVTEPPAIAFTWETLAPRCAGDENGALTVKDLAGGAAPFRVSLGGQMVLPDDTGAYVFENLGEGSYEIEIEDANGCANNEDVQLVGPVPIEVAVGPDLTVALGDSLIIRGQTSAATFDTILWSPAEYLRSPNQLESWAVPLKTTLYKLTVIDTNGCSASDELVVVVERQNRIYIPNAASPTNPFTIFGGSELLNINYLRVYDRWGECVFLKENLEPNNLEQGWNTHWRDRDVLPGVYVFVAEVQLVDGTVKLLKGDVTVAR
ncbi:MAG: hypothetical protein ACK4Q5_06360 [Saprospiraceae bacterium]